MEYRLRHGSFLRRAPHGPVMCPYGSGALRVWHFVTMEIGGAVAKLAKEWENRQVCDLSSGARQDLK